MYTVTDLCRLPKERIRVQQIRQIFCIGRFKNAVRGVMASSCPSLIRTEGVLTSAALEDVLDAPSPPATFRAFSDALEDAILLALFATLEIFSVSGDFVGFASNEEGM
ncbi:hypothetical protein SODG_007438 [Sodalis praecaptivus]